jgi:hypothetical protein
MSLTGALEAFPLPEVLRLLARSSKSGALRIEAADLQGRLYLEDGFLTFATTRHEEDLAADLVTAGLIDSQDWVLVERREKNVAEVLSESVTEQQLTALLADQIADVIFRLTRRTDGDFEFSDSVGPRYNTGVRIDVDGCIAEAEERNIRWTEIESVIPAITFHLRMVPDLTDRAEVSLPATTWQILAALHGEGSIEEVARRLGMTDFAVGQVMAGLVRDGLLEIVDLPPEAAYAYGEDSETEEEVQPDRTDPTAQSEDDASLLRGALSEVVAAEEDVSPATVARKHGLGARVQEAKEAEETGE